VVVDYDFDVVVVDQACQRGCKSDEKFPSGVATFRNI